MTRRKLIEKKLLIASANPGKVYELSALFSPYGMDLVPVSDFKITEPEETGTSFMQNAILKAEYYGDATGLVALADDSGLCIDALDSFPGVYSARFAGPNRDFTTAFDMIEEKLKAKGFKESPASFICALALRWPDGHVEQFEGKITGKIAFPASQTKGFGYNQIFIPDGYAKSFADLGLIEKNKISHRALALKQLIDHCF